MQPFGLYERECAARPVSFREHGSGGAGVCADERKGGFHYGKLLTDGLLSFSGDHGQLVWELWRHRQQLSDDYTLAVMQFIRMSQDGYEEEFGKLLEEAGEDRAAAGSSPVFPEIPV